MMTTATATPIVVDKAVAPAIKSESSAFTSLPYEVVAGSLSDEDDRCTVLVFGAASVEMPGVWAVVVVLRTPSELANCTVDSIVAVVDRGPVSAGACDDDAVGLDCGSSAVNVVVGRLW